MCDVYRCVFCFVFVFQASVIVLRLVRAGVGNFRVSVTVFKLVGAGA